MTEAEAKTKWCPHARVVAASKTQAFGAANRAAIMRDERRPDDIEINYSPEHSRCIASACMAWRWNPTADQVKAVREAFETHIQDAVRLARAEQRPAVDGYCGLAGAPR